MSTERITRCPHCATVFRVQPEQLHQAQGWLRCGQCRQVFDASARVLSWRAQVPQEADRQTERLDLGDLLRTEHRDTLDRSTPNTSDAPALSEELLAFERALASFPRTEPARPLASPATEEAHRQNMGTVTNRRRRPAAVRWWMALLVLLLLLQLIWAARALWAVHWPGIGQGVQAVCERLSCTLPPWREPRVLVLAHARLMRSEHGHELHWTLRNTAAWPVVAPSMELTLLDVNDQVLVRRVFTAPEGQVPAVLAGQQHATGRLAWTWPADLSVKGYRLLAFYP